MGKKKKKVMGMTKEERKELYKKDIIDMTKEERIELYNNPIRYTEEDIIDGEKVTVYIELFFDGSEKFAYKWKLIKLFGKQFKVPLHANITPMIVRYTGESCYEFRHGREYMVIFKSRRFPEEYSIVDESGDDYLYTLKNFEIVSEGDGPAPEGWEDYEGTLDEFYK